MAENVGRTARWSLMKSLRLMGVDLKTNARLEEITDDAVVVTTENGEERILADTVIMAVGAHPVNDLASEIMEEGIKVVTIGDALQPRKLTDAVREGFEEALKI